MTSPQIHKIDVMAMMIMMGAASSIFGILKEKCCLPPATEGLDQQDGGQEKLTF